MLTGPHSGRVPLRIRVGVTGHRTLAVPERVREAVGEILDRVLGAVPESSHTPLLLAAVSPLAEGADRIVAEEVLRRPGARLEAFLPVAADDYEQDFTSRGSVEEFRELLARADAVQQVEGLGGREAAYARAGELVLGRCDVLIAVWDGEPARGEGGTARIIERARTVGMPLFLVDAVSGSVTEERTSAVARRLAAEANGFNEFDVAPSPTALGPDANRLGPAGTWIIPFYARADRLAVTLRRRYSRGMFVIVAAAAVAVLAAALHATRYHEKELLYLEAVLLLVVGVQYAVGRLSAVHPRWIASRFLAERFRSAVFLAVAGAGGGTNRRTLPPIAPDPREEWARRAFAEVWADRPATDAQQVEVLAVGRLLADDWLGGQTAYYRRRASALHRAHLVTGRLLFGLFGTALVVALLHPFVHDERLAEILTAASLTLPALGAAVAAWNADREYSRHADRYHLLAEELEEIRPALAHAGSAAALQGAATRAEEVMLEENRDWFQIRRFHDLEPHV